MRALLLRPQVRPDQALDAEVEPLDLHVVKFATALLAFFERADRSAIAEQIGSDLNELRQSSPSPEARNRFDIARPHPFANGVDAVSVARQNALERAAKSLMIDMTKSEFVRLGGAHLGSQALAESSNGCLIEMIVPLGIGLHTRSSLSVRLTLCQSRAEANRSSQ
jgi:hypothetical protein